MTDIVVVGSVNLDLSASVSRLPLPGETVTGATMARFPGGKGANQALAARRLGANVTLIAAVGQDAIADEALAIVRDAGVDLSYCAAHPTLPTGVAMICVATSGENHIVVAPGANASLVPERLPPAAADALICQLEVPASTILAAAAHFSGMVCINLAPARDVSDELLAVADLLIVNQTESDWYGERLALGRGLVATTYGAAGARLTDHGRLIAETRAPVVEVVDTTGAGDAFTAALTVALVEGMSPQRALEFACAAGSIAATGRGAQPSMPDRATLEKFLTATAA